MNAALHVGEGFDVAFVDWPTLTAGQGEPENDASVQVRVGCIVFVVPRDEDVLAVSCHGRKAGGSVTPGHDEQADLRTPVAAGDLELGQSPRHGVRSVMLHLDDECSAREDAFVVEPQELVTDLAARTSADNAAEIVDDDRRTVNSTLDEVQAVVLERIAAARAARVPAPTLFESGDRFSNVLIELLLPFLDGGQRLGL